MKREQLLPIVTEKYERDQVSTTTAAITNSNTIENIIRAHEYTTNKQKISL